MAESSKKKIVLDSKRQYDLYDVEKVVYPDRDFCVNFALETAKCQQKHGSATLLGDKCSEEKARMTRCKNY